MFKKPFRFVLLPSPGKSGTSLTYLEHGFHKGLGLGVWTLYQPVSNPWRRVKTMRDIYSQYQVALLHQILSNLVSVAVAILMWISAIQQIPLETVTFRLLWLVMYASPFILLSLYTPDKKGWPKKVNHKGQHLSWVTSLFKPNTYYGIESSNQQQYSSWCRKHQPMFGLLGKCILFFSSNTSFQSEGKRLNSSQFSTTFKMVNWLLQITLYLATDNW